MSSKKKVVKPLAKDQASLVSMFSGLKISSDKPIVKETSEPKEILTGNDEVKTFYASLSEAERIAHEIAVEKLGTSYDVVRTHGFQRWLKARK